MLEKYPALQSNDLVAAAGLLIKKVKEFDYEECQRPGEHKDFFESLDGLALAFSSRVSEYLMGDLDSNVSLSSASSKAKSYENLLSSHEQQQDAGALAGASLGHGLEEEVLSPDRIDSLLMHHDCGVDLALQRAKIWSKYAKDVISYVEKRTAMQVDFSKNLTKLVQTCRPQLQEESYLPFQSIYCTALDNDLELCASMQTSSGLLQGYKFLEPLQSRRSEHEKVRKSLKESWHKELKRMHDEVDKLRKARTVYIQRHQEWERCRDAARIAEQGAELGATAENKLDKRKKLEEEAAGKAVEAENHYRLCVDDANVRHRNLLGVKSRVLQQIRELLMQADQTMKAVTVSYFQQQHTLTAPCPVQFQTLCESSRLYEPGSQYMKFVKRLPDSGAGRSTERDPFCFEPYTPGMENMLQLEKHRKWSQSLGEEERRSNSLATGGLGQGPLVAWTGADRMEPTRWHIFPFTHFKPIFFAAKLRATTRQSLESPESLGTQVPVTRLSSPSRPSPTTRTAPRRRRRWRSWATVASPRGIFPRQLTRTSSERFRSRQSAGNATATSIGRGTSAQIVVSPRTRSAWKPYTCSVGPSACFVR